MPYEQRYCDAKSDLENFTLRNIIVIIVVDFVRFQFPSRQALAIKLKSLPIACRWDDTHTHTHTHTHTPRARARIQKEACTCALNYLASVER